MGIVEQLAHSNWRAGLLPEQFEISVVFRSERVLDKIRVIFFQLFYQVDSLYWRYSFVDVVQQFNFITECLPYMLKHLDSRPYVWSRFH